MYRLNQKRPAFDKILIPEYQSNDIENSLVLSLTCQIRFSNLPGFNPSFLPVEIGDFFAESTFRKHAKFPFVLLPSNNDTWMCSCILPSWETGIPLNKLFIHTGAKTFQLAKTKESIYVSIYERIFYMYVCIFYVANDTYMHI